MRAQAQVIGVFKHFANGQVLAIAHKVRFDPVKIKPLLTLCGVSVLLPVQIRLDQRLFRAAHMVQQPPAQGLVQPTRLKPGATNVQRFEPLKTQERRPDNRATRMDRLQPSTLGDQKTIGHGHCV